MNEAIKVVNLNKFYGSNEVIKDISFDVYQGEIFGFLGKNGVGKSTTIDCITGIKPFNKGEIYIEGYSIKKDPLKAKKCFGFVNSEPLCYETMTGREYIKFIASLYNVRQKDFDIRIIELSQKFDIQNDLDKLIREYSHGMKQKISIISNLVYNPDILILDEPTVGLDMMIKEVLIEIILDYKKHNKTVFVTSHDIEFVKKICDRVAIMNKGRLIYIIDLNSPRNYRQYLNDIFLSVYSKDKDSTFKVENNASTITINKKEINYR